jgi:hypothetical protein
MSRTQNIEEVFARMADALFRQQPPPTSSGLRTKRFEVDGNEFLAIEQNPNTGSEWAREARAGKQVVQFKSLPDNNYVGVSVNGNVTIY